MNRPFRFIGCLFLIGMILTFSISAAGENIRIEDILSSAFPSHLTTAPSGDLAAWVENREGLRNIRIARGPEYIPVTITKYDMDDGQELGGLVFNHDATLLVFVRGGDMNRAGEHPNPRSYPAGVDQVVWAVSVQGGSPRKIGSGRNPVPSPKDNRVIFSERGRLMLADLSGDASPKPLFSIRGRNGSASWSPDADRVAFSSTREEHAFIGIYDLSERSIEWVSPSVDRDGYPVWSPDGKRIAFIRFPSLSGSTFQGGMTFELMVGDTDTLKAETIWTCPNPTGGFSQYYPAETLRWANSDFLVFYSEHEKWMHLYSISLSDHEVNSLTPGRFEVEDSALSPDGRTLIYNANAGDIDRRHLWKVAVSGGDPVPLTSGSGLEWSPAWTAAARDLIFLMSTAVSPASPAVLDRKDGSMRRLDQKPWPDRFPLDRMVSPEPVIFEAADGLSIHGQLFLPESARGDGERPAVIFMHGGPIRQMMPGWHMREYYHGAYGMNQYLAAKGYVVLSVNYRSGIGYGFDFRNAPRQGPRGASEYRDIVAAGRYLQKRPEVDPDRIGLWGGSYGGYLTAMGLARDSQLFAAGVDLHGVHDWSLRGRRREGGGWDIQGEDLMNEAYQSSPVADVESWSSPVLFIHGDDDRNVDFIQTTDLVQRLRRLNLAPIEMLIFPDEVHGFLRHDIWLRVFRRAADFFDRHLMNK